MYTNSVQAYQQQYHHLVSASLTSEQAEAIMHVIEERRVQALGELATKRDLDDVRVALKRDIDKVHTELKHEIAMLDNKLTYRMTIGFIAVGALSLASPHLPDIIRFITALMK